MLDKLLNWFSHTNIWVILARHTVAHFTFRTFGYPKFPMSGYFKVEEIVNKDPDAVYVFVSADKSSLAWRLTNWLTKANWGHAGFIVKEGKHIFAYHMKGNGLNKWHILDLMREADNFALLKMPLSPENLPKAKKRFQTILSAPDVKYDYQMEIPAKMAEWLAGQESFPEGEKKFKLYCSEFVYVVGHGLVLNPKFTAPSRYGKARFEPDNAYEGCELLYEN